MSQVKISTQAVQDLEDIWSYVAKNNPRAADNLFDKLRETFAKLAKFPQMGQGRSDLASSLQSFPVKSYLIFISHYRRGNRNCAYYSWFARYRTNI